MKKVFKVQLVLLVAIISLSAVSCVGQVNAPKTDNIPLSSSVTDVPSDNASANSVAKYDGIDGKNALELLKTSHKVTTKTFDGVGEYVESIDAIVPDKTHFFSFYVNGEQAQVGAGQYITKSTETIEWRLEEIK